MGRNAGRTLGALALVTTLMASVLVALGTSAGALQPPFVPSTVTVHQEPHVICRAYGGSIAANTEADQDLGFTVTYPTGVQQGDTFTIKIRPDVSLYPRDDRSSGITATIQNIYNQMSQYVLPAGLTINSVSLGPINGNVEANPDAGYYVDPANVPHAVISGKGDYPLPGFDPMTLPASQRLAIPGTTPNAFWNTSTNQLYTTLLGSGVNGTSAGTRIYAAGSALQGPSILVNVTATATPGTDLQVKLGGQLPGSEPRNYTGSQPGNFPAPASSAALTSVAATAPWASTNGTRYSYTDSVWGNPTYLNTVYTTALGGLVTVAAKAACAPGHEATADFPTPPSYYTGPGAIPNGTSPPLTNTHVLQAVDTNPPVITITSPIDGGNYVTEAGDILADFDCNDAYGSGDDICTGDVASGAVVDSSPGTHSFTVQAQDLAGNPTSKTVTYTVAPNQNPVADHGPDQTGKKTGNVVTLDGSASSDPDGPPVQSLTYTWAQTGGVPVTLSDVHAEKPTFTVPPNPVGTFPHAITFALTVEDPYGGTNTTADSVSVQVVATAPAVTSLTRTPSGTLFTGDLVTLGTVVTNPDGGPLTYAWSQVSGRTTSLSSSTAANPTYFLPSSGANPTTAACTSGAGATSPTSANCPRFQVVVTTAAGLSSPTVAQTNYSSSLPTRPVANAGPAQVVSGGSAVTLDGSGSVQAQGHAISYAWTQTAGPPVTLSGGSSAMPSFTAPASAAASTTLSFSLVVVDTQSPITSGANQNTSLASTVNVVVQPNEVVANAGPDQVGKVAGNVVTLDATGSTDPGLAPLSYSWVQTAGPAVSLSDEFAAKPTFTVPPVTSASGHTFTFEVSVSNGGPNPTDSDVDSVDVSSVASTPSVAVPVKSRAGGGATFYVGDVVTLSAAITNPDGTDPGDYTYVWSQVSGRTTALSSTTVANPTYVNPSSGANPTSAACTSGTGAMSATSANCPRFQVVVTKVNTGKSSSAAVMAAYGSSLPARPVANAGSAQNVKVGSGTITLDGSASTQAQGHAISYAWTQTAGPAVTLSSSSVSQPTFTAPLAPATYTFSLTVVDTQSPITGTGTNGNTSLASTVTVTVSNYASPVASAGANQSVLVGSGTVTLDASGSSQADGHALTYEWTQTGGTPVVLSSTSAIQPTFTVPNAGTNLKFRVTVTDTENPNPAAASTTSPEVTIAVGDFVSPVASAGADQMVHRRDPVTLDATGSSQADGHPLTYQWTQTAGTPVTLSDPTAAQPTFTAPDVAGWVRFTVTVTDTLNPNPAAASTTSPAVQIDVMDYSAPIADAGANQSNIAIGATVTLDGTASSQVDGHPLTYQWTQTAGPAVTLSNSTAAQPTFTAPTGPVTLTFQLVVDDTFNSSAPATVNVNVKGIPGLDYATEISGDIKGEKAASNLTVTVVNNGTVVRTISSGGLTVSITRNGSPVSSSDYSVAAKSTQVGVGKQTNFTLTWNHGNSLELGDDITVSVCNAVTGDDFPANNCAVKQDPAGPIVMFAWPKPSWEIKSTATSNTLATYLTNMSSFTVRPVRVQDHVTVAVQVNDGPVEYATPPTTAAQAIGPDLDTRTYGFVWNHPRLTKGDTVTVTACAVVPHNTAVPNCWARTVTVK